MSPFPDYPIPADEEQRLRDLERHGVLDGPMPVDGGDCEAVLAGITGAGVDLDALAERLQVEGRDSFDAAWHSMIADIAAKAEAVGKG